jgi:hypothetical protein
MSVKAPVHVKQNLISRDRPIVHAPATPDSDYYLCRPARTRGQYGPPHSRGRTVSPVTCKACLRKLAATADPVKYLNEPGLVTAYVGEGDPYGLRNTRAAVLATATRFTLAEGASFSGWVVRNEVDGSYSDPIRLRTDALAQLRDIAAEQAPKFADILEG